MYSGRGEDDWEIVMPINKQKSFFHSLFKRSQPKIYLKLLYIEKLRGNNFG